MPLPTVAIVGRPNVGKSTLFNRLVGKRVALVDDRPGVTRDRREGEGRLFDLTFRVMDTAGFEDEDPQSLPGRMRAQTEAAVKRSRRRPVPDRRARGADPARRGDRPLAAQPCDAGGRRRQQGRRARRAKRACSRPMRWAWASRSRSAPSMARGWPTCSRSIRPHVEHEHFETEAEEAEHGERAAEAGDRRPAQRRQVDPGQQDAGRGADDHRARGRHHPRQHQHGVGVERAGRCGWSTPRASEAGQGRGQAGEAVGVRYQAGDRLCRGGGAAARRHARAGSRRTCASPTRCWRKAGRWSSRSTNGTSPKMPRRCSTGSRRRSRKGLAS